MVRVSAWTLDSPPYAVRGGLWVVCGRTYLTLARDEPRDVHAFFVLRIVFVLVLVYVPYCTLDEWGGGQCEGEVRGECCIQNKQAQQNVPLPTAAVQVIPVLEQQLSDVQEDLRTQEGEAKDLDDEVGLCGMPTAWWRPTKYVPSERKPRGADAQL